MKNNRGLTLVELIAVLVVLIIIGALIVPNVFNQINQYREQMYNDQVAIIEAAARSWADDHTDELPSVVGESYNITFERLQAEDCLDADFKSVISSRPFLPTSYVEIRCTVATESNYKYNYTYIP